MTQATDRELLEAAARAAGIEGQYECWAGQGFMNGIRQTGQPKEFRVWNPLMYDDQAFRLAVALGLAVDCSRPSAGEPFKIHHFGQDGFADPYTAIRRAIVRAAAAVGGMGGEG